MPYMQRVEGTARPIDGGVIETTYQIYDRADSATVGGLSNLFASLNHLKTGAGFGSVPPTARPLVLDFGVTRSGLE